MKASNKNNISDLTTLTSTIPNGIFIPPKPEILNKLQTELQKPEISKKNVCNLINHDVAISAAVLKTVNSSYFGLQQKVTSISHALSLLGMEPTISLVSGFLLKQSFDNKGMKFPRYWDEAIMVAEFCAFFAKRLQLIDPESAYTLGLFHDVGIPIMAHTYPDYLDVLKQANQDNQNIFTDTEDKIYKTNHAVIGCVLTHEWGLNDSLRDAILNHHDIESIFQEDFSESNLDSKLLSILQLAELATTIKRTGSPYSQWELHSHFITEFLGKDGAEVLSLVEESQQI